jgi:lipopolysaccharide biosynthesis glycosyltransferase
MDFEIIKDLIKSNDLNKIKNLDINHKLLYELCLNYSTLYYSTVIEYLPNNNLTHDELKKELLHNYSFLFYRPAYLYSLIVRYIYNDLYKDITNKKEIYINFIRYGRKINYQSHKNFSDIYLNLVIDNIDYLIDMIDNTNVYISAYFNNLIKYFLPLPYEIIDTYSLITYRKNVNKLYKKNNIDYYNNSNRVDIAKRKNIGKPKYIDQVRDEIDIHIPITYFKSELFEKKDMILLGDNKMLYIGHNFKLIDNKLSVELLYERKVPFYNLNHFINAIPLELITPRWNKLKKRMEFNINDIIYIQILRELKPNDLFRVFDKLEFNNDEYKYLYQNTPIPKSIAQKVFSEIPTFWFFTPWSHIHGYSYNDRECYRYKIKKNITDILDLTVSIMSSNPFYNSNKNIKGEYYDLSNVLKHDKEHLPPLKKHKNYRCLSLNNDVNELNKICDIDNPSKTSGRRRLQEIFMKSRKYSTTSIYTRDDFKESYEKLGFKFSDDFVFYDMLYYPDKRDTISITIFDFDKYCLKKINCNGFFFTNFTANLNGGELMLTDTNKYLEYDSHNKGYCLDIKRLHRETKKYAYIAYLTGDNSYFLGAMTLGYSLRKTNTEADVILMVTEDVPQNQIKLLNDYFNVVHIKEINVPAELFKDYDYSRFKHVFTKLEALKFIEYDKIILIDIDMIVIRNIDELFNLNAPSATSINKKLTHGKIIPKKYMIQQNNPYMVSYGINAGLMLLKPSIEEYNEIIKDLNENKNYKFKNPEQEYLSIRYSDKFTHIDVSYNYQFGFAESKGFEFRENPHVIHYSHRYKPWIKFIDKEKFNKNVLIRYNIKIIKEYYELWFEYFNELDKYYSTKDINLLKSFELVLWKK